jgi:hypothetical protein
MGAYALEKDLMRPSSGCKNALRGIYKKETLKDK